MNLVSWKRSLATRGIRLSRWMRSERHLVFVAHKSDGLPSPPTGCGEHKLLREAIRLALADLKQRRALTSHRAST